jgi:hypothetical protein
MSSSIVVSAGQSGLPTPGDGSVRGKGRAGKNRPLRICGTSAVCKRMYLRPSGRERLSRRPEARSRRRRRRCRHPRGGRPIRPAPEPRRRDAGGPVGAGFSPAHPAAPHVTAATAEVRGRRLASADAPAAPRPVGSAGTWAANRASAEGRPPATRGSAGAGCGPATGTETRTRPTTNRGRFPPSRTRCGWHRERRHRATVRPASSGPGVARPARDPRPCTRRGHEHMGVSM